ncbi:MAG: hypothetical protein MI976_14945 [Pseudomonadales bacterium]|nr:hypothetical protein [Pseudomonadales bacterium]
MKSFFIYVFGLVSGILLTTVGGYFFSEYMMSFTDSYDEEVYATFNELHNDASVDLVSAKDEYKRWIALADAAFWSVDEGLLERAKEYANKSLELSANYSSDWNYSNALHKSYLTLGRVALRNEDLESAGKYLIKASEVSGSPQLDSFGPNMVLANELLEKGQSDVVLQYLSNCELFWEMGSVRLRNWSSKIEGGESPSFGANLLY